MAMKPRPLPDPKVHSIQTARTARVLSLGPRSADDEWCVLHGYGQTAREVLHPLCPHLAQERLLAPEGLSRFYRRGLHGDVGASWMTREERQSEIADALGYLDRVRAELGAPQARRRHVLGFSQGGATAARWAVRGALRPHRLVLWCCDVPPDLEPEELGRLAGTDVCLVSAVDDPMLPTERVEEGAARLRAAGVEPRTFSLKAGHAMAASDVGALWEEWRARDI